VVGPETSNGVVNTRSPGPAAPAKSDAGRRSGIPPADISDRATEADGGDTTVSSPEMAAAAAEKKRSIFSMFRRKKDAKETKLDTAKESRPNAAAAVVISPLRHRRNYLPTVILIIIGRAALLSIWPYALYHAGAPIPLLIDG